MQGRINCNLQDGGCTAYLKFRILEMVKNSVIVLMAHSSHSSMAACAAASPWKHVKLSMLVCLAADLGLGQVVGRSVLGDAREDPGGIWALQVVVAGVESHDVDRQVGAADVRGLEPLGHGLGVNGVDGGNALRTHKRGGEEG